MFLKPLEQQFCVFFDLWILFLPVSNFYTFFFEITNSFRVLGRCEVILVVIGYISFTALLEIDQFTFQSLNDSLPFKRVVTSETKPELFNIDRSSSMKNNWASEYYTEGLCDYIEDEHNFSFLKS